MAGSNRYKELELAQLRSFSVAALQGNFSAAARQLGLSITTVWQQVRALERRLGATLLRVQGRTLELTPEGRQLCDLLVPAVTKFMVGAFRGFSPEERAQLSDHLARFRAEIQAEHLR